jgi:hypothetical protein
VVVVVSLVQFHMSIPYGVLRTPYFVQFVVRTHSLGWRRIWDFGQCLRPSAGSMTTGN